MVLLRSAFLVVLSMIASPLLGTNIEVSNVIFSGHPTDTTTQTFVYLTVTWQNAWRNKTNHDAAWIFFKLRNQNAGRSYRPCKVKLAGHEFVHNYEKNGCSPSFFIPAHQGGIVVYPATPVRGRVSWRIKIALDLSEVKGIDFDNVVFGNAYALEMVNVPEGPYFLGDSDVRLQKNASAFFQYDTKKRLPIKSEKELIIGSSPGALSYENSNMPEYRGDLTGPVPETFPKGFQGFYVMKYELTSGQYTDFLNALSNQPSAFRANFGAKEFAIGRGTVSIEGNTYVCGSPNRPANYVSWDDGCAFADWAGLRPLTELEFEKAARGPHNGVAGDFAWGTSSFSKVSRFYNQQGELILHPALSEQEINEATLDLYGASFYWVMDLCGSLWERTVTIGSAKGRSFKGTHGDGLLDAFGNATNEDWPNEQSGGFGYRGGGTYDDGMAFGPNHAPVGSRNYGSWGDGPRSVAYGFRACLTSR